MTRWLLQRSTTEPTSIDASNLRLGRLAEQSSGQILRTPLVADGAAVALGDLFSLQVAQSDEDEIIVEGDLRVVHGLAARHDRGRFTIVGDAGNYLAASMTGGTVTVRGAAGDFVAAPLGAEKIGMSGGLIQVTGDVGSHLAHRLRRGTVLVDGSAKRWIAASMVAGTVAIAGATADKLAIGMKRGTLLLGEGSKQWAALTSTDDHRFSEPLPFPADFLRLFRQPEWESVCGNLLDRPLLRVRGDRNVGGIGEVLFPA